MNSSETAFTTVMQRIEHAAAQHHAAVHLLAVSKTKPADAVRALAALGQRAFGENYVQEGTAKRAALDDLPLEWHMIGPLQSNKCREVAERFDWLQSLDRAKLVEPLARWRPADALPLNVLVQVNIDDEGSKSGCAPGDVAALAATVAAQPSLALRGLMAIPAPHADRALRREAFVRMRALYDALAREHAGIDTLSMGMSDDFELAIECGATMVRVGSALFGARG